ncbi:MAG: serine dehydratase beta chain [Limosilactobacillus sp.]|uniref:serine dehydratase beta chain n=1 Tax=Limosilactobacillus sp. TaxID=2773925 RepID=UPI0026FFB37D|nr:serine dehydratase beta chain [Limosilactobacillus sp.]
MTAKYRSVFDIIGPIMIGPSSSHTAGAVAIGRVAHKLFGETMNKVTVHYYESFAKTHRGHGTDYAIAAGILGMEADDSRVPDAPQIARNSGIDLRYVEEDEPSPIHHPNTAILDIRNDHKKIEVAGCSIGGGAIEVRKLVIEDVEIYPAGPLPIVIYIDYGKKNPNAVELTAKMEKLAPFSRKQSMRTDDCDVYEYDIKNYMNDETMKKLESDFDNLICLQ